MWAKKSTTSRLRALNPEEVSEIFVRINSKGQTLNQSDFILTLNPLLYYKII